MSYTDEEEPVPPTVVERALAVVEGERDFILDVILLVVVTIAVSTGFGIWPWVGFVALLLHVIHTYRGKK